MRRLILASTSPYRQAQLQQLRLSFEAQAPLVDEEPLKRLGLSAERLVEQLAREKAISLAPRFPDALILGGDQVAEVEGTILCKPGSVAAARQQLQQLAGRSHRLWTALAVHQPSSGRTETAVEKHTLAMRPLSPGQIAAYVDLDQPLDCAGSYRIEALGISLFSKIEGNDFTAIMGLPLMRLVSLLECFGVSIPPDLVVDRL